MKTSLLHYLNSLPDADRQRVAATCGTSVGYLRKAISTGQKLGPALCVSIEKATDGSVTRRDLRPDDWFLIWPEISPSTDQATA